MVWLFELGTSRRHPLNGMLTTNTLPPPIEPHQDGADTRLLPCSACPRGIPIGRAGHLRRCRPGRQVSVSVAVGVAVGDGGWRLPGAELRVGATRGRAGHGHVVGDVVLFALFCCPGLSQTPERTGSPWRVTSV